MSSNKILLVEDDEVIISGLQYVLENEGFVVQVCQNTQGVTEKIAEQSFDLVLLDVTLPDGNGFEIFRLIKKRQPRTPVIFLTAIDDEGNVVKGLEMGADDYITKPFRIRELMARIKTVWRRTENLKSNEILTLSNLRIDASSARVEKDGEELELTAGEYKLLLLLAKHQGKILSRAQILEDLWDDGGEFVSDNALTAMVKRLREKLDDKSEKIITTVRGLGYLAQG